MKLASGPVRSTRPAAGFGVAGPSIRLAKNVGIAYIRGAIRWPEGVLAMRLWIAMTVGAIALMGATWWLTMPRSTETSADDTSREPGATAKGNYFSVAPTYVPPIPPPKMLPRELSESAEPIAVVAESAEVAIEPSPVASEAPVVATGPAILLRIAPRPEAGIEPTPFMPYADEESELARLRRPGFDRVIVQQTDEPPLLRQLREFTETAEPPLNVSERPATSWRPCGKLPCSVR
jgi:hypothetical protein